MTRGLRMRDDVSGKARRFQVLGERPRTDEASFSRTDRVDLILTSAPRAEAIQVTPSSEPANDPRRLDPEDHVVRLNAAMTRR